MSEHSIVYWYPDLEKHLCGYCKNEKGNVSHGMWAKTLTVEDYQNLIDRGWRRSGNYCYKPLMKEVCCPMYTIKCDALNFQLSKSQKKVVKKFNKFLKDGELNKSAPFNHDGSDNISEFVYRSAPGQLLAETSVIEHNQVPETSQSQPPIERPPQLQPPKSEPKTGVGADPAKPPCKKAKLLRMERKKEKLLKRGMSLEKIDVKNEQKSVEDFLGEAPSEGRHKFKITFERLHKSHKHYKLTAGLFAKYQIAVHNESPDDCDEFQYYNFLVDSPLQHVKFSRDSDLGFGSFHQLYWLDDKLIAVGVVDILPKCVSAVYFFYDPDYRDLTLGTYGSLREVEFARTLHQKVSSIQNYYMGFYIHSCPKMRYKGKLTPSFLLCPETYNWIPIERCVPKLEANKYSRLEDDEGATDHYKCSSEDIDEMKILIRRKIVLFKQYREKFNGDNLFNTIGELVGKKCSKSLIIIGVE